MRRSSAKESARHWPGVCVARILVGVAGFEPTTTCPPDRCATKLRYTPRCLNYSPRRPGFSPPWRLLHTPARGSALEELEDFFQFHADLADDLAAQGRFLPGPVAFQAQAGAADGVALLVQQATDLADHQHVVALVVAAVAAALDRLERRELGFPVAQHVRLHVAQLADLADGEVALGRDRREFAVAAGIKHGRPRRPRRAP